MLLRKKCSFWECGQDDQTNQSGIYSLNNDKDGLTWEVPLLWTLKKPHLLQKELEPTSRGANNLFIYKATQCYCSAFVWKYTQKYLLSPPSIILRSGDILSHLEDGKFCFLSAFFALSGPYRDLIHFGIVWKHWRLLGALLAWIRARKYIAEYWNHSI